MERKLESQSKNHDESNVNRRGADVVKVNSNSNGDSISAGESASITVNGSHDTITGGLASTVTLTGGWNSAAARANSNVALNGAHDTLGSLQYFRIRVAHSDGGRGL
jgi:hypothetical protein